jgi:hypothetical protein
MDQETRKVLEAVAALDVFHEGDNDDAYCPFMCNRDDFEPGHDADCPISIARRLIEPAPAPAPRRRSQRMSLGYWLAEFDSRH